MARAATAQDIPTRRVVITSEEDMPADYSTTPGGTLFGTTPGGTKIVYERAFLMNMRNSPLARTPPGNLPNIPGRTSLLVDSKIYLLTRIIKTGHCSMVAGLYHDLVFRHHLRT